MDICWTGFTISLLQGLLYGLFVMSNFLPGSVRLVLGFSTWCLAIDDGSIYEFLVLVGWAVVDLML